MQLLQRLPAGARPLFAAAFVYAVLAVAWAAPASLSPHDSVPDLGDPLHLSWVMAWDAHQIVRRPWALFEANAFHPYPHSLTFSDHLLPEALLAAPVFWLTGNAVLASNLALLTALVLSAGAMCLLVRYASGSTAAGFVAGVFYAFNGLTLHEVPRVHVVSLQWWPLALIFLDRFVDLGRAADARRAVLLLVLQGLSGTYDLIYTALLAPVGLVTLYVVRGRRPGGREAAGLLWPAATAAVLGTLFLWPYVRQVRALGFEKSWAGGADLLSYVLPFRQMWLWPSLWPGLATLNPASELPHFLGFLGLPLVLLGVARLLTRRVSGAAMRLGVTGAVTLLAGLVLSMGPLLQMGGRVVGPGPYGWMQRFLPLTRGMASPERAGTLAVLGAATLAGLATADLLRRLPSRRLRGTVFIVLAALLPLEQWIPRRPAERVPTGSSLPHVYRWLSEQPPTPLVELPLYPERQRRAWAAYLFFSTRHWRKVPLGRASFYPPAHDYLAWNLRGFPDKTSLAFLDRVGIRTVVVHPRIWEPAERAQRLAAVEAEPRLALQRRFDDVPPARYTALGLGEERVYELRQGPAPAVPCSPEDEVSRENWQLASTGVNKPDRVRDGERSTAWFTARPQRPGDRLDVDLGRVETIAAVTLDVGYPHEEFGRNLVLALGAPEGPWRRLPYADGPAERLATLDDLLERPRQARLTLRFERQAANRVRLMIGPQEEEPAWPRWAIPELRVYRSCR
jgi:hypothetical protein